MKPKNEPTKMNRRSFFSKAALMSGTVAIPSVVRADVPAGRDPFPYEVQRTDEEWRALLGEASYAVMREGKTERQRSSDIWAESRAGHYECKGCDLPQYRSFSKVNLPKGWLFFTVSEPNAQMMAVDSHGEMSDDQTAFDVFIEVHCRRCGSHIGHILKVDGEILHCINGASLNFIPEVA